MAFRTIDKGAQSDIDSPRQTVARTAAEWTALWKAHDAKPAPVVNFDREIVVALFMGSRPTAGYSVAIVAVTEHDGALVVTYKETAPPPGAITAQILTFPYHIVALPKHTGPVTFQAAGAP